jgi:DNA (cytosine-5)-methyltransferase 1
MPQSEPRPRIGSLCSGYGGLDLAVMAALGTGEVAWHAQWEPPDKNGKPDRHQWAARILAHRFPGVPNHGDITAIDYRSVEPVGVLTAGFPCTDVSLAGLRAGIAPGTRSGIWSHVARAIAVLRPSVVFIENVRSLISAPAHSDLEPCPWCVGDVDDQPVLRALGAVLGDLADCGFDAEWICLPASDVGACHERFRIFIAAWPAEPVADPDHLGAHRGRSRSTGRDEPAASREPAALIPPLPALMTTDADRTSATVPRRNPTLHGALLPTPNTRDVHGSQDPQLRKALGRSVNLRDVIPALLPTPDATHGRKTTRTGPLLPGITDWGSYGSAITDWETVMGRPAPNPHDDRGRLAPAFVEWMMGVPSGWVTDIPGITRTAQLKALGNGVVPQQGAAAFRMLIDRTEPLARIVHGLIPLAAPEPWHLAA